MVEMVTINELVPAMNPLIRQMVGVAGNDQEKLELALQQSAKVLTFFERLLGDHPYFGGEHLSLAEVVAGTVLPRLPGLSVSLDDYPKLRVWTEHLMKRDAWIKTEPSPKAIEAFKSRVKTLMAAQ